MQELSTQDVLGVWEIGKYQTLPERALTLLAAYCPEMSSPELKRMSIGTRDALLLRLREALFGSHFVGLTTCPRCCTSLEIEFNSSDVGAHASAEDTFKLSFEEYEFTCRLPNSSDLLALVPDEDLDSARASLLDRCLLKKRHLGAEIALSTLSAETIDRIADEMASRDPQADVRLALVCPDCSNRWEAIFDIVSLVFNEISAWAIRLLRQVHTLSLAYGWREIDILALSPLRRQAYLELLGE